MKLLLITIVVLGFVYATFLMPSKDGEGAAQTPDVIYQKEIETAKSLDAMLQATVDQRLNDMDELNNR